MLRCIVTVIVGASSMVMARVHWMFRIRAMVQAEVEGKFGMGLGS